MTPEQEHMLREEHQHCAPADCLTAALLAALDEARAERDRLTAELAEAKAPTIRLSNGAMIGRDAVRACLNCNMQIGNDVCGELLAQLERAEAENATLRADIENAVWNLAGCECYATGYGLDSSHSEAMARPALLAVKQLALRERQRREAWDKIMILAGKIKVCVDHTIPDSYSQCCVDDVRDEVWEYLSKMTALATWERKNGGGERKG